MAYLTQEEYTDMGGALTGSAYDRLEFKACKLVDQHTFSRLRSDTSFSEPVKRLTFELIGLLGNADTSAAGYQGAITSEGNDGYSVSFAAASVLTPEGVMASAEALINQYLEGERNQAGELLLCRWA